MLSLFIETCTERSIIALIKDHEICYTAALPFGLHSSNYVVPKIEEGFQLLHTIPEELSFITVGIGPGSYTGMRVGATVAKTLSYSCKVPLIGISSLKLFIPDQDGPFAAIFDAKMSGSYILTGHKVGDSITYEGTPEICSLENIPERLRDVSILVSPNPENLKKKVEAMHPGFVKVWEETAPDPLYGTKWALEKFEQRAYTTDGSLDLLYLRNNL